MSKVYDIILESAQKGIDLRKTFFEENQEMIFQAASKTALTLANGGKLIICENAENFSNAQHIAFEMINIVSIIRPPLPVLALSCGNCQNPTFSRQLEALGNTKDIFLAISAKDDDASIIEAINTARFQNIFTMGLTSENGKLVGELCDLSIMTPHSDYHLILETHLAFSHVFCRLIDYFLFENPAELAEFIKIKER